MIFCNLLISLCPHGTYRGITSTRTSTASSLLVRLPDCATWIGLYDTEASICVHFNLLSLGYGCCSLNHERFTSDRASAFCLPAMCSFPEPRPLMNYIRRTLGLEIDGDTLGITRQKCYARQHSFSWVSFELATMPCVPLPLSISLDGQLFECQKISCIYP